MKDLGRFVRRNANRIRTATGGVFRQAFWAVGISLLILSQLPAQEANWIWSPDQAQEKVPTGSVFFRKTFNLRRPEQGQITIAADDEYELFVNGKRVGKGNSYKQLDEYDITNRLSRGKNLIAVRVDNRHGKTAALVARVLVKEQGRGWRSFSSDRSWRISESPLPLWNTPLYNDGRWVAANPLGKLGETAPWDIQAGAEVADTTRNERFTIDREFQVQRLVSGEVTGSLIAMAFNEFGHLIVSREGGPLLKIRDSNNDDIPDQVQTYCEKVTSCQGILPLNGEVFVTGMGPDGQALYRLSDKDRDGTLESVRTLVKFEGESAEHGAHGISLGPDGLIYVVLGNHVQPTVEADAQSPYFLGYEGDLVPRYEDPGGHAVGIKAPGGTVIRTDVEGTSIQRFAGGLRNAYDLAFNAAGELFVHDSDMESDEGSLWYRPTRVYHVVPGAEFGWRSGWSKWQEHFTDSLPAVVETGRGSPTGAVVYNHVMFPDRYQNALFLGDWSEGRILAVTLRKRGAGFVANSEEFISGQPLNVTDLDVGPDGGLYFVTGGRGTGGGVYRVSWLGKVPEDVTTYRSDIGAAIRQPQPQSAWARQSIARLRQKVGGDWEELLNSVATTTSNPAVYRTRALDLMQLYGPAPDADLLSQLAKDPSEEIRQKAARLMGLQSDDRLAQVLAGLLVDTDPAVRRAACESLLRSGYQPPPESLANLLDSEDRYEQWAAREMLKRIPAEKWKDTLLTHKSQRVVVQSCLALANQVSEDHSYEVLETLSRMMTGFVSDQNFVDLLRVMQVAIDLGELSPENLTPLREQLTEEFPAGNSTINQELMRLLAFLQAEKAIPRFLEFLESEASEQDKLHVALQLRFISGGWNADQRMTLLEFYERAQRSEAGTAVPLYVMNATRDFSRTLTLQESLLVLENGGDWPNASLGALYKLPKQLDADAIRILKTLDQAIVSRDSDSYKRLKVGIVAVLARSGDQNSIDYLKQIWERDAERRQAVAMGFAQKPQKDTFEYILNSLPVLEGVAAQEVLMKLTTVQFQPDEAEPIRQVIINGLRLKDQGATRALALLEHWTGQSLPGSDWNEQIVAWQEWFATNFPDSPPAELPKAETESKWQYEELAKYLVSEEAQESTVEAGAEVFVKAQCAKCHKFGDQGEPMGPDLTSVAKRFTTQEILESVLYPSHVISSQYRSKTLLLTDGRTVSGIVTRGPQEEYIILQSNGKKIAVRSQDVDQEKTSNVSSMPEGLLEELELEEVAALFNYLKTPPVRGVTRVPQQ